MTITAKDLRIRLSKISSYLEELSDLLEERQRLISVLRLTPSNDDNLLFISLLSSIKSGLKFVHQDISSGLFEDEVQRYEQLVESYKASLQSLEADPYINVEEYFFTEKLPQPDESTAKKSVRFKDHEDSFNDTDQMRSQLMGTSNNFKPYTDDNTDAQSDTHTLLSIDTTNQELFAQHQQQLLEQDQNLDALHSSVRTQHTMGLTINDELDEHLIILNDLERGVDGSYSGLRRATRGINDFRRKARENGSLTTIIVLTVILILLLVVLN